MNIELKHVAPPTSEVPPDRPAIPAAEYERRIQALFAAAQSDWVLVYGDREHAANLAFLTGFDPRFEEALLLLGPQSQRVLMVGNEGMGYVISYAESMFNATGVLAGLIVLMAAVIAIDVALKRLDTRFSYWKPTRW